MSSISMMMEEKVMTAVRLEPVLLLLFLSLAAWLAYKIFLRKVSFERHQIFRSQFKNLAAHLIIGLFIFATHESVEWLTRKSSLQIDPTPYIGFLAVVWACIILVKILRIMAFEYLFAMSMKALVPLLIVNVFTLILSLILTGWLMTRFFGVDLTPLLATSAILSIVLGLALQDTLGNLFAGISLQIDKPFELGDWIELKNGNDRIAGQVQEITWRATILMALSEELVTIPNRNMAQWQIFNFSGRSRSFVRSHVFRIPYGTSVEDAKIILLTTASAAPGILKNPPPAVIVTETTESWITLKAFYNIADYGSQFGIADRFLTQALLNLEEAGITLARQRISIAHETPEQDPGAKKAS